MVERVDRGVVAGDRMAVWRWHAARLPGRAGLGCAERVRHLRRVRVARLPQGRRGGPAPPGTDTVAVQFGRRRRGRHQRGLRPSSSVGLPPPRWFARRAPARSELRHAALAAMGCASHGWPRRTSSRWRDAHKTTMLGPAVVLSVVTGFVLASRGGASPALRFDPDLARAAWTFAIVGGVRDRARPTPQPEAGVRPRALGGAQPRGPPVDGGRRASIACAPRSRARVRHRRWCGPTPDDAWHPDGPLTPLHDGIRHFVAAGGDGTAHGLVQRPSSTKRGDTPISTTSCVGAVGLGIEQRLCTSRSLPSSTAPPNVPIHLDHAHGAGPPAPSRACAHRGHARLAWSW